MSRGLVNACLLIVTLWGVSVARPFLIPVCIAALLAFMMAPLVRWMRRKGFPEWSAVFVSTTLLLLPFVSVGYLVFWQGEAFVRDFPVFVANLNHAMTSVVQSDLGHKLHFSTDLDLNSLVQKLEVNLGKGVELIISGLGAVVDASLQVALVLLFAILMLASRDHLRKSSEAILHQKLSLDDPHVLDQVIVMIEKFLFARLFIVGLITVLGTGILLLFGIKYAFLFGTLLGIVTLIPVIGFLIALIPLIAVSLGMGNSFLKTVMLVLVLEGVNLLEGNVLTPKIVGRRLNINALVTFLGIFAGSLLWGVWGMFLSIPILGILRIVFNEIPSMQPWSELLAERSQAIKPAVSKKGVSA